MSPLGLGSRCSLLAVLVLLAPPARAQVCPTTTTATTCYAGITGPPTMVSLALSTLATMGLSLPSGTPAALNVSTNQPCVSATVTCTTLQVLCASLPAPAGQTRCRRQRGVPVHAELDRLPAHSQRHRHRRPQLFHVPYRYGRLRLHRPVALRHHQLQRADINKLRDRLPDF